MFRSLPLFLVFACLACLPSSAVAYPVSTGKQTVKSVKYEGMEKLRYRYGPLQIKPGQGNIIFEPVTIHPRRPGFITRFEPNLIRVSTGKPMPVDAVHIHHATWLFSGQAHFAGGEEKSIIQYPRGFGVELTGNEKWFLSYMLHNYTALPEQVYLTWNIDFVPISSPGAKRLKPLRTKWMNVAADYNFPTFDALRGWGRNGRFVFPEQAPASQRERIGDEYRWKVDRDLTLIHTMGHMHPGALYTTLYATRDGVKRRLFRSRAKYFGSDKPVSFDMAITAPLPGWRVKLRKGDVVNMNVTTDTSENSWFESMGVMPIAFAEGHAVGGVDPFSNYSALPQGGKVTHGSLPENRNYGGFPTAMADPRALPDGPKASGPVAIKAFRYQFGGASNVGPAARPPVVRPGQRLSFVNLDATPNTEEDSSAYHTITSCRAPCTGATGVIYPLADGQAGFDSGQLGFGPFGQTPAANRNTWSTPRDLSPGTYTFFCRVHPFMRGAFRVKRSESPALSSGWSALPQEVSGV